MRLRGGASDPPPMSRSPAEPVTSLNPNHRMLSFQSQNWAGQPLELLLRAAPAPQKRGHPKIFLPAGNNASGSPHRPAKQNQLHDPPKWQEEVRYDTANEGGTARGVGGGAGRAGGERTHSRQKQRWDALAERGRGNGLEITTGMREKSSGGLRTSSSHLWPDGGAACGASGHGEAIARRGPQHFFACFLRSSSSSSAPQPPVK